MTERGISVLFVLFSFLIFPLDSVVFGVHLTKHILNIIGHLPRFELKDNIAHSLY